MNQEKYMYDGNGNLIPLEPAKPAQVTMEQVEKYEGIRDAMVLEKLMSMPRNQRMLYIKKQVKGLHKMLGIPKPQAKEIVQEWLKNIRGQKGLVEEVKKEIETKKEISL